MKNPRQKSVPRDGNGDKDKVRQQLQFAQQNQQVYQELLKIKNDGGKGKGRDNARTRSESPRGQKDSQRQFQILVSSILRVKPHPRYLCLGTIYCKKIAPANMDL
jgi:hypothetical protein